MTAFIYANNINTSLASAISSSATSLTLASSANLPASIPSGMALAITLNDQATRQNFEVIYATSISGATLSGLLRAQEGTSAQAWGIGDYVWNGITAGQMRGMASGRLLNIQVFDTAGTFVYTPTLGTTSIDVELGGAGAGSAATIATGSSTMCNASGGGGGAYARGYFTSGFSGLSITIGAGGTAAPAGNASPGGNGGASSFGSLLSVSGGVGGPVSSSMSSTSTGTSLRASGGPTMTGTAYYFAPGGASSYGPALATKLAGGDGGACGNGAPGQLGAATVGSGGVPGNAAVAPGTGAGGGAASTATISQAGAAGADGFCIVREYA